MSGRGSFFLVSNICTFSVSWVNLYLVAWFVCFVVALLRFLSFFRFYVCLLFKNWCMFQCGVCRSSTCILPSDIGPICPAKFFTILRAVT